MMDDRVLGDVIEVFLSKKQNLYHNRNDIYAETVEIEI